MTEPTVTGLVLAGGRSSRFGRDKLAEPIDGRPLLWHAIDAVRPLVRRGARRRGARLGADPAARTCAIVRDRVAFEGPLTGLLAGLLEARAPLVIVVGGDMPTLVGEVLAAMLAELDGHGRVDAVVLQSDGQARPAADGAAARTGADRDGEPPRRRGAPASGGDRGARPAASSSRRPGARSIPTGRTLVDIDEPVRPGLTGAPARRTHEDLRRRKRRSSCIRGRSARAVGGQPPYGIVLQVRDDGAGALAEDRTEARGGGGDRSRRLRLATSEAVRFRWASALQVHEVAVRRT